MALEFRTCTAQDHEIAVPLMFSAGPDSYRYVFSQDSKDQAIEFLHFAFTSGIGEFSYAGHTLALDEGVPVGIVGIWRPSENLSNTFDAVKAIFSFYGWRKAISVIRRGLRFEKIVKPPSGNVLCLHNFAVDPNVRSKGYGRQIIEYVCATALTNKIPVVCLDVDHKNPRARSLYLGQEFKVKRSSDGNLTGRFTSVGPHDYMEKHVN